MAFNPVLSEREKERQHGEYEGKPACRVTLGLRTTIQYCGDECKSKSCPPQVPRGWRKEIVIYRQARGSQE